MVPVDFAGATEPITGHEPLNLNAADTNCRCVVFETFNRHSPSIATSLLDLDSLETDSSTSASICTSVPAVVLPSSPRLSTPANHRTPSHQPP